MFVQRLLKIGTLRYWSSCSMSVIVSTESMGYTRLERFNTDISILERLSITPVAMHQYFSIKKIYYVYCN